MSKEGVEGRLHHDVEVEPEVIFVYGTLRRGAARPIERFLPGGVRRIGKGSVPGRLYEIDGYPGLVGPERAGERVVGEVYALRDREGALRVLDAYEGCSEGSPEPHEYRRVVRAVALDDGAAIDAWVYEFGLSVAGRVWIASGDYLDFIRGQGTSGGCALSVPEG